VSGSMAIMGI